MLLETAAIIVRNFALRQPYARALIYNKGKAVRLSLSVPRPWNVRAGQYINLWIPGVSFRSFVTLQSHPFTIASWTNGRAMSLDFLIEPRAGFTKLLSQAAERRERPYIAFFSGPHGISVPVSSFGSVVMVASGFGIAAQLPYLKEIIEGYNKCEVRTRRIHLIWQLREQGTPSLRSLIGPWLTSLGEESYAEDLVDRALQDDTSDNGYILRVSIYFENRPRDLTPSTKGTHGRLTFYSGTVNLDDILAANLRGQYIEYHENGISHMTSRESGPLVVTGKSHLAVTWNVLTTSVSANEGLRDRLREANPTNPETILASNMWKLLKRTLKQKAKAEGLHALLFINKNQPENTSSSGAAPSETSEGEASDATPSDIPDEEASDTAPSDIPDEEASDAATPEEPPAAATSEACDEEFAPGYSGQR
ncbi:MAG: hypothetical protein LQ343_007350 [Gyalolechia ehrenbergii]|nr:MAG: hypothetical protein LQ343_007350 [Gyalolechia ehrenbergii]